jgi:hypothetical protein
MKQPSKRLFDELFSQRSSLIEIILTTLLLALGINFISGSLPIAWELSNGTILWIGIILCVVVIIYFVVRLIKSRYQTRTIQGFLTYDHNALELIAVREYYFSRMVKSYIDYALKYMPNSNKEWTHQSLDNAFIDDRRASIEIIIEAIEYFIIKELSIHLKTYFEGKDEKNIKYFHRTDIRNITESNRFLKIFTAPRLDSSVSEADEDDPEITRLPLQNMAFVLILPKESIITRIDERRISIDTKQFKMIIETFFLGINSEIPVGFHRHYLHLNRNDRVTDFSVGATISISFKSRILLSRGVEIYQWLDSFLDKLNSHMSESDFFANLQWMTVYPIIEHIEFLKKTQNSSNSHQE